MANETTRSDLWNSVLALCNQQNLLPSKQGISNRIIAGTKTRTKMVVDEYPFDALLLKQSNLYRKSRHLFLAQGGSFCPAVQSSPRSLSSKALLSSIIEYSPLGSEMEWIAKTQTKKKGSSDLLLIRDWMGSLNHEQNHRILWQFLPPPVATLNRDLICRYLNFAESLVIVLDMAIADELGEKQAWLYYQVGCLYDPGTDWKKEFLGKRLYRTVLQMLCLVTWMKLEMYSADQAILALSKFFGAVSKKIQKRVFLRAWKLDEAFVSRTNQYWQWKNYKWAHETLRKGRTREKPLVFPKNIEDDWVRYLWTEKWLDLWEI